MSQLTTARDQIVTARKYTLALLENLDPADWFRQPREGVTHIAWQVGHLAVAEYRLAIERLRGQRPEDEQLISADFLERFAKGSKPTPDRAQYPQQAEIVAVFSRVHEQALAELPDYVDGDLQAPPLKPHKLFDTKIESLYWSARHEMLHAGQIGLLRRLLGRPPLW